MVRSIVFGIKWHVAFGVTKGYSPTETAAAEFEFPPPVTSHACPCGDSLSTVSFAVISPHLDFAFVF